jgi:hypothetical protein
VDGRTDMMKLTVVFRNFAKAPNNAHRDSQELNAVSLIALRVCVHAAAYAASSY